MSGAAGARVQARVSTWGPYASRRSHDCARALPGLGLGLSPAIGLSPSPVVASRGVVGWLLGTVRRPTARAPEPGRQKKADAAHAGQGFRDCSGALGLAVPSVRVRTTAPAGCGCCPPRRPARSLLIVNARGTGPLWGAGPPATPYTHTPLWSGPCAGRGATHPCAPVGSLQSPMPRGNLAALHPRRAYGQGPARVLDHIPAFRVVLRRCPAPRAHAHARQPSLQDPPM
jgi:hypothetical protein